jgi:hypothetical protein
MGVAYLEKLAQDWPEQVERYRELFAGRSYLPAGFAAELRDRVRALAAARAVERRPTLRPAPAPVQPTLAV